MGENILVYSFYLYEKLKHTPLPFILLYADNTSHIISNKKHIMYICTYLVYSIELNMFYTACDLN